MSPEQARGEPADHRSDIWAIGARRCTTRWMDGVTFRSFLSHYQYDERPLRAAVVDTEATADWTRETIRFAGADNDRVLATSTSRSEPLHPSRRWSSCRAAARSSR